MMEHGIVLTEHVPSIGEALVVVTQFINLHGVDDAQLIW